MADILSQAEIEALLNSLSDNPTPADMPPASVNMSGFSAGTPAINANGPMTLGGKGKLSAKAISYEVYDFRRSDKFSKDQLRTLQILHETFARLGGTALSSYLRTPVSIDLVSLEQVPYEEYIRSIYSSVFTVMSIPPLTGQAVMEMEFNLVYMMVDKLLGGPGKGIGRRALSDIEKPLVRQMIERLFVALKNAWEGVVIVNPGIEGMETSSQFVQICPPNDIVVTILFEVKIGNARGAMSICIPYLLLKPITTKLSAQKWFVNTSRKNNQSHRKLLSQQVSMSNVPCVVNLGQTNISIHDFLELQPGDVIRLNQHKDAPMRMTVGKTPKFEGRPGLNGKRVVFTIQNVIDSE